MDNLQEIPKHEQHHFIRCNLCGSLFDCRDLSQVLFHTHQEVNSSEFTSARKVPEPILYIKGKVKLTIN
jgi:hypothetical protein